MDVSQNLISDKFAALQPSVIREILKFTMDPEVISFAAGSPAPEAFPKEAVAKISEEIFSKDPLTALQYGATEGYGPLRRHLASYLQETYQIGRASDRLLVTSGAQQAIDLAVRVLCNKGDTILCEDPTFLGSLNAFRANDCHVAGIPMEQDGMDLDALETALRTQPNVKLIYIIPNFQNPTGITTSLAKRKAVYALAKQYGVMILEDNPYGELRVSGEMLPSIKSMDTDGIVIYAGTFSKILSPGIRVGFAVAPEALIAKMTVGKQCADVHTPLISQMIVYGWMQAVDMDAHISRLRAIYAEKLELMGSLLASELGGILTAQKPEGGMFYWAELPKEIDMVSFCKKAVLDKVAMVPGNAFFVDESAPCSAVRLNFSMPTKQEIETGITRLAAMVKREY